MPLGLLDVLGLEPIKNRDRESGRGFIGKPHQPGAKKRNASSMSKKKKVTFGRDLAIAILIVRRLFVRR